MPNGHDKNLFRLSAACGEYRERYGTWPATAHLHPPILENLRWLLTPDDFQQLNQRLSLEPTSDEEPDWISVSGPEGRVSYDGGAGWDTAVEARRWFGVQARLETEPYFGLVDLDDERLEAIDPEDWFDSSAEKEPGSWLPRDLVDRQAELASLGVDDLTRRMGDLLLAIPLRFPRATPRQVLRDLLAEDPDEPIDGMWRDVSWGKLGPELRRVLAARGVELER